MIGSYLIGILLGLDVLANALIGGQHYQTISCRVGESITSGGWASRVKWPEAVRRHCLAAVYQTIV